MQGGTCAGAVLERQPQTMRCFQSAPSTLELGAGESVACSSSLESGFYSSLISPTGFQTKQACILGAGLQG